MVQALAARYSPDGVAEREELNTAYVKAMEEVAARFADDPDVQTLHAAAVMNTMPWNYWEEDGRPRPGMSTAVAALEHVHASHPNHPGARHYYIHAVEASPDPDRAVPSADILGTLVPSAGHLVHMPSHIYIRVGRYADASDSNIRAIAADEDYISQCRAQGIYPAAYYPHNIHFLTATLAMEGRGREMLDAARKVASKPREAAFCRPGFGFPHLLAAQPLFAMVRFGRWEEVLIEGEFPADQIFGRTIWHYARGLALLARDQVTGAEMELAALRALLPHEQLEELKIWETNSLRELASIGENVLAGEISAAQGDYDAAVAFLQKAVALEDSLTYSEPPDWPVPARHNLGAVLLAAGRPADAEAVYREDLDRHRNNGWALAGLAKSLEAQRNPQEADEARQRLARAWTRGDVELTGSRF